MEKIYKGRLEILNGMTELEENGLLPDNISNMVIVLEEELDDESTLQIASNGDLTLKAVGLTIGTF